MLLDGNNMITLLGLPEWDERILDMLEEFRVERPVIKDWDTTIFIKPEGYHIEMLFDTTASTPEQKAREGESNLYFNQIILQKETAIKLPFGIETTDDYAAISQKIGKDADSKNKYIDSRLRWLLDEGEKKYIIHINFKDDSYKQFESLDITLYDDTVNYNGSIPFQ